MRITYKEKRTGASDDKVLKEIADGWGRRILDDCKLTPDQYPGTPYKDTGHLVASLVYKPTGLRNVMRSGTIGRIVAPADRLQNGHVMSGFRERIAGVWRARGLGWSDKAKK